MVNAFFDEIVKYTPKRRFSRSGNKSDPNILDTQGLVDSKENLWILNHQSKVWSAVLLMCVTVTVLLIFVARTISVQVLQRDKYISLAQRNRIREIPTLPERGVIFDRSGNVLARNRPAFSMELNTQFCSNQIDSETGDAILTEVDPCFDVARALGENTDLELDLERIKRSIDKGDNVVLLALGLEKEEILPIEANLKKYPGLVIVTQPIRDYVYSDNFAHVLGYVGLDSESMTPLIVGKQGVEEAYNEELSGIPGALVVQMDSTGTEYSVIAQNGALPGKNVETYLDLGLQQKAYEVLKQVIENPKESVSEDSEADAGVIIAQDPQTGGILAMVSYPTYNPNYLVTGLTEEEFRFLLEDPGFPFFNRAISASYPPGSTFKMVVASGALMEGVVTEHTIINDPGYISVGSFIFRNWKLDGHGEVNMRRAIQVSNDTYFYTVGGGYGGIGGLGIERLSDWAKMFGFGALSGIDISGEVPGYMPDGTSREWYLGDTFITSIGQGDVLATPLQINNMVAYFANGGYLMQPRVVRSIDGVGEYEVQVITQNIVNAENYKIVREGMHKAVVFGGTGWPVFDFELKHGVKLAGKTGTSEYTDPTGKDRTHAWFTVFGPYEEDNYGASEIVLTVFLEGGGGGSNEAAPIANELLDYWFGR